MPNWSYNNFSINGKKNEVKHIFGIKGNVDLEEYLKTKSNELSLRTWFPMPKTFVKYDTTNYPRRRDSVDWQTGEPCFNSDEEFNKYLKNYKAAKSYQKRKYGYVGWYDYNCATLGTKWDSELRFSNYTEYEDNGETYVTIGFEVDTAWSAPMPWFEKMTKKFPHIRFAMECHEESGAFDFEVEYNPETKDITTEMLEPQFEEDYLDEEE